jgi:hypothetical protein
MTQTIVVDKNTTVVVDKTTQQVVPHTQTTRVIYTGVMGPPGTSSLSTLSDVDVTNLQTGSLLVYSTQVQRWQSTTTLENQLLNGGAF